MKNRSTFFSLLLETLEWNGSGAGQKSGGSHPPDFWPATHTSKWPEQEREVAEHGMERGHRKRFEQRAEILPLPLCSHALVVHPHSTMALCHLLTR